MGVPVVYRKAGEGSLANYNWVDIANGVGYNEFYLCADVTGSAAASYALVTNTGVYSDKVVYLATIPGSTAPGTKFFDNLFLATLNSPRVVNGNVLVNIAASVAQGAADTLYFIVKFVRIREGVETTLGQATSATMTGAAAYADFSHNKIFLVKIPIVNEMYKRGDRIGIRLEGYNGTSSGVYINIGIDPANRTSMLTNENIITITKSIINVPFRIDL